ncbi:gamma-glutamyl-gamma-aminobutyrate hydrolase family protein [Streptomyces sp. NPDC088387]|uniref:gamma-glutamyl-gamma-aminobutyrate hydrolase family protein n=1 Tax=Streptomyces sp. NPDC088387 TaxID=3365859 RepID=UPI003830969A
MQPGTNGPRPGRRPVVGICARTAPVTLQGSDLVVALTLQTHVAFLAEAGCTPVLLPLVPGAEDLVDTLDALLVPGGPDLDPALYGQRPHPATRAPSPDTDRTELALLHRALDAGLPLLAICRGMQLLNVAHGGTLHQHLAEVTGHDRHRPRTSTFTLGRLPLKTEPGSRLAALLDHADNADHADSGADGNAGADGGAGGGGGPYTACHHHQALDTVGAGLTVTGRADDGTVEAVEAAGRAFVVGVQWECGQTSDKRLHYALADAARRSMNERAALLPVS